MKDISINLVDLTDGRDQNLYKPNMVELCSKLEEEMKSELLTHSQTKFNLFRGGFRGVPAKSAPRASSPSILSLCLDCRKMLFNLIKPSAIMLANIASSSSGQQM